MSALVRYLQIDPEFLILFCAVRKRVFFELKRAVIFSGETLGSLGCTMRFAPRSSC